MTKKIRKKHSPSKRKHAIMRFLIKNTAMVWVASDKPADGDQATVEAWDLKTNKKMVIYPEIMEAYATVKCKWSVYCAVFCRDQLGREYVQGNWICAKEDYRQDMLANFLSESHSNLLDSCNPSHVLNLGWVAFEDGKEHNDSQAIKLMEQRDCWSPLAPHEIKG